MILGILSALGKAGAAAGKAVGRGVKGYGQGIEHGIVDPYKKPFNDDPQGPQGPAADALQFGGNMYQPSANASAPLAIDSLDPREQQRRRGLGPYTR